MQLLSRKGITSDMSWEDTMRVIMPDPEYSQRGGIRHVTDKKALFSKYQEQRKQEEMKERAERKEVTKAEFLKGLKECELIHGFSNFNRIKELAIARKWCWWLDFEDVDKRMFFELHVDDLRKKEKVELMPPP